MSRIPQPNSPVVSVVSGGASEAVNRAVAAGNTERSLKAQKEAQQAAAESREKQQLLQLQQNRDLAEQKMAFDREQSAASNRLARDQMAQSQQQFQDKLSFEQDQARIANQRAQQQTELANKSMALDLQIKALETKKARQKGRLDAASAQKEMDLREEKGKFDEQNAIIGFAAGKTRSEIEDFTGFMREKVEEDVAEATNQIQTGEELAGPIVRDILEGSSNLDELTRNNYKGAANLMVLLSDTDILSQTENALAYAISIGVTQIKDKSGILVDLDKVMDDPRFSGQGLDVSGQLEALKLFATQGLAEQFSAQSILDSPQFEQLHNERLGREFRASVVDVFRRRMPDAPDDFEQNLNLALMDLQAGRDESALNQLRSIGISDVTFASTLASVGEMLSERAVGLSEFAAAQAGGAERGAVGAALDILTTLEDVNIAQGPMQSFMADQYLDMAEDLVFKSRRLRDRRLDDTKALSGAIDRLERGLERQDLLGINVSPDKLGVDKGGIVPSELISLFDSDELQELSEELQDVVSAFESSVDPDLVGPPVGNLEMLTDQAQQLGLKQAELQNLIDMIPLKQAVDEAKIPLDPQIMQGEQRVDTAINNLLGLL